MTAACDRAVGGGDEGAAGDARRARRPAGLAALAVACATLLFGLSGCTHGSSPWAPVTGPVSRSAGATPSAVSSRVPGSKATGAVRTTAVFTPQVPQRPAALGRIAGQIRRRAAAAGLAGLKVGVGPDGRSVMLSADGDVRDRLAWLGAPAVLEFRPVEAVADATGATVGTVPAGSRQAFAALDCTKPATSSVRLAAPAADLLACASQGQGTAQTKYLLGPVMVNGTQIASARPAAATADRPDWRVLLTFTSVGSATFATATTRLAAQQAPADQFAAVLDGQVLTAPQVLSPITGGSAEISGNFTPAQARSLAAQLATGSLPTRMLVSQATVG